jgi:hypothetical protein
MGSGRITARDETGATTAAPASPASVLLTLRAREVMVTPLEV